MRKFRNVVLAYTLAVTMLLCAGCGKKSDTTTEVVTETNISTNGDSTSDVSTDDDAQEVMADPTTPEAIAEQEKFEEYLNDSFETSVVSDTLTLHYNLAHPEDYGITPPEVTYGDTDMTEEGLLADKTETEDELEELQDFDRELLTYDQRFTYDILYNQLETNLESYDNPYLYEPFAYTSGLHSNLPITLAEYSFYDQGDVDDYLKLLELTPDYIQICLDFEQEKIERGLFMNTHSANEVIRQCSEFIQKPEENLLIETFNDNIEEVPDLTDEQIADYKQANHDAVINYIIPAYQNIIAFFQSNKNEGENDLGLAHFEGGKEYYEYLIRSDVGSDKTPEEIIELLTPSILRILIPYTKILIQRKLFNTLRMQWVTVSLKFLILTLLLSRFMNHYRIL